MSNEEQAAYDKALKRIKACHRDGGTVLHLSGLGLTRVPPELAKLTALKALVLNNNQLTTLPPELGKLTALTVLNLARNALRELPESLKQLKLLRELTLHGNDALGLPTELLGPTYMESSDRNPPANPAKILEYYFSTRGAAGAALRELRVIVVGHPKAGKTSLIRRLNDEPLDKNESETHGINISKLKFQCHDGPMLARVWDFGGQHVLHAMHEFFLTERCLYLLVLEQRTDRTEKDAKYWLQLIRSYAGDAPVVVALNQSRGVARPLGRTPLEQEYAPILDWIPTECASEKECPGADATIKNLRSALARAMDGMNEPRALFPVKWAGIKKWLEDMKEPFLAYADYAKRCQTDEPDAKKQAELAELMNDLGIALNYADDPRLMDTTVLRPDWLANGIYAILRANMLVETPLVPDGVLTEKLLGSIYAAAESKGMLHAKDYPVEKHAFLLRLMGLFRLSFPLDAEDRQHLVPALLAPDETGECVEPANADRVRLRYDFDVVPAPLMGRFMVGLFPMIERGKAWKRGMCLRYGNALARVWMDVDEKHVFATVGGAESDRDELLQMIRETMRRMVRDYRDLRVEEQVEYSGRFVPRATLVEFGKLPPEEPDDDPTERGVEDFADGREEV